VQVWQKIIFAKRLSDAKMEGDLYFYGKIYLRKGKSMQAKTTWKRR